MAGLPQREWVNDFALNVRVPKEVMRQIDEHAKSMHIRRSEYVRRALEAMLNTTPPGRD